MSEQPPALFAYLSYRDAPVRVFDPAGNEWSFGGYEASHGWQ
jgi:hypothetical protein